MNTHTIPDKVMQTVDRVIKDDAKAKVLEALKSGKTLYVGRITLKGVKAAKPEKASPPTAVSTGTPDKDKDKDKDKNK